MRKKTHMIWPMLGAALLCLVCTGCAGIDFRHEVPRDYSLQAEEVSTSITQTQEPPEETENSPEDVEASAPVDEEIETEGTP